MSGPKRGRSSHGFASAAEIRITHDAPEEVRAIVMCEARAVGISFTELRAIVCRALHRIPDPGNWSEPNVMGEIEDLIRACVWYRVYDVAEAIARDAPSNLSTAYQAAVNRAFEDEGIGWRFARAALVIRSEAAFEQPRREAQGLLDESGRMRAAQCMRNALADLSKRPNPDTGAAVFNAVGALEALARDVSGQPNMTLGELLKNNRVRVAEPLKTALEKIWGYASDRARHIREGSTPSVLDAELIVGLSSQVIVYIEKHSQKS